jgi:CheY-like chemotaxis protein
MLPEDHQLRTILEAALHSGERAADLTRQLLAYAGKGRVHAGNVDLVETLRTTWDLLQASIPRSVELKVQAPSDLPPIHGDATQVQQILMNLILNAAEAIPEGRQGMVVVRAETEVVQAARSTWSGDLAPGRYVVVQVRDNGSGIRPELLHKIFDPFFTTKFTGRGLGLAAVHGIIRSNHGFIDVESVVGKGTAFRVFLPAGTGPEGKAAVKEAPHAPAVKAQILVVDDEAVVRNMAKATLERSGHQVHIAAGGEEAVERIQASPALYSLVLLDFNMPGLNGEKTLDAIRSIRSDLPVVICSGYSDAELRSRFGGKGVAGFLQKPFRAEVLADKVSALLAL